MVVLLLLLVGIGDGFLNHESVYFYYLLVHICCFSLCLHVFPSVFTVTPIVTVIRMEQANFILESLLTKECELVSKGSV